MPLHPSLISASDLHELILQGQRMQVWDCRFDLADPAWGAAQHQQGHVPGAVHRHLDVDLCGPKSGTNGRHPLPDRENWCQRLSRWGLDADELVVVLDQGPGMYAARAWWMLRWAGHSNVRLLDGGWQAWLQSGGPVEQGGVEPASPGEQPYPADRPPLACLATVDDVLRQLGQPGALVVDARAPERFRGETEPLDPVAGHIPGACNLPFTQQLAAEGRWQTPQALEALWRTAVPRSASAPETLILQCGSGVTACHLAFGLHLAGLEGSALYGGSWSEWCADASRPVATGPAGLTHPS